jgi:hypothetical protein
VRHTVVYLFLKQLASRAPFDFSHDLLADILISSGLMTATYWQQKQFAVGAVCANSIMLQANSSDDLPTLDWLGANAPVNPDIRR